MAARTGRQLIGIVEIKLLDGFSGPATRIGKAGNDLFGVLSRLGKLNINFAGQLGPSFAAAARSMDHTTRAASRLVSPLQAAADKMKALHSSAAAPITLTFSVNRSGLDRAAADHRRLRRELERPIIGPPPGGSPPTSPGRRIAGGGGGAVGPMIAGGAVANRSGRASRYAWTQGADELREDARGHVAGIPEGHRARFQSITNEQTRRHPSIRRPEFLSILREGYFSAGGPRRGGLDNIATMAPDIAAAMVNLQTRVGPRQAAEQLTQFMRAGQNMGFADDVPRMRNLLDAMVRAQAVEGKEFDFRNLFTFARRSKSAGLSLNDDFLMNVAPALIADMTPASAGVALGTLLSRQTAGQNSRSADAAQREYGIRNDQGLVNNSTLVSNPFQWVMQTLIPALQAKGVDVNSPRALGEVLPKLFRDQTAQGLVTRMISQREEFMDAMEAYKNAVPNRQAAEDLRSRDPHVALEGATSQLAAAMGEVSKPIITAFIPALHQAAEVLNGFGAWMRANPQIAPYVSGGAVVGAGGAAVAGSLLAARGVISALGLGGSSAAGGTASGLLGTAGALGSLLRILPIAGGVITAGTVAGGPISKTFEGVEPGEKHNFGRRIRRRSEALARRGRDEQFGPLVTPEEQGPPMPPQMHPQYQRMLERRDQLQRQIDELRAGGEPAANSPRAQTLSNLSAELGTLSARISEAEAAVRQAGQALGSATAQGVQSAGPEAYSAGASVGQRIMEGLRSAIGGIGGGGYAPPRATQDPPGRALGGPVTAGQLYTVGEAGPELFSPGANGSIIPNHANAAPPVSQDGRSEAGRYGGSRNVNMTFSGPLIGSVNVTGATAKEVAEQLGDELRSAMNGIFSDTREAWG